MRGGGYICDFRVLFINCCILLTERLKTLPRLILVNLRYALSSDKVSLFTITVLAVFVLVFSAGIWINLSVKSISPTFNLVNSPTRIPVA